ncbi:MAG: NAD-dependent malic enzyme [Candidatus Omnitrophica bacterium]|nr:NAD-dependent malic enzyme [Candidatus Omnitrophota bacterium]
MAKADFLSNNRFTLRLELVNKPGVFASVATLIASVKADLGAVDIVEVTPYTIIRDVTFYVSNQKDADKILKGLEKLENVKTIAVSDKILLLHLGGKIQVQNKTPIQTRNQLSMAYTPGVAKVAQAIAETPDKVYKLTIKSNSVAIVTDGSAVLGLGNLGPEAALPVMEGKAMIFKEFANIDAWPICLATQDVDEIVKTVQNISPAFGGINLEDISAPRCFEIEEKLKKILSIPVMHDDQHGTAVVILAALKNALKIVKKDMEGVRVVVNGLGAAGAACCRILLSAGVRNLYGCNRKGVVLIVDETNLGQARKDLFSCATLDVPSLTLREALCTVDVFIGVSAGNILTGKDLNRMKEDRIVFAMANPDPEVDPHEAFKVCRIFATGRSDFPNQINNALAFPGIFRGALNVRAKVINEEMKIAAADAIANLVLENQLSSEYIIPSIFDKRVVEAVTKAVEQAAYQTGVARKLILKDTDVEIID